jgi:hypothetical protein
MSKHTPAPWNVAYANNKASADVGVHGPDSDAVGSLIICDICNDGYDTATQQANAKLIAAAPELLNAVRFLLSNPDNRISDADLAAANAAIAKATGEA